MEEVIWKMDRASFQFAVDNCYPTYLIMVRYLSS